MTRWALVAAAFFALAAPAQGKPALHRCGGGLCGSLERPLDPSKPHGRTIAIGFKLYRAAHPRGPAIVAIEGGPGYPSIGSKVEYRGIYQPLLKQRDLLLVDQRGTGRSALIDCRRLQAFGGRTSGAAFAKRVGACADQIDRRFGARANELFSTRIAAADVAAVIRALKLGKVDLYGDSYGTFFSQYFMARHAGLLHSVVLDSAYPVRDLDPWYASSGAAARNALEIVSPGSVARLAQLLKAPPVSVHALADMVQDSGSDPVILRELDASVRAALAGDAVPLRRLVEQSREWDHSPSPADYFSDGLYMAVSCADYPQLFSLSANHRASDLAASLRGAPDAFQPFTPAQWLTISGYSQPYDVCLDWPRPVRREPPLPLTKVSVPVLVLGGDLDSLTPFADAQVFGPELGTNVRVVKLRNTVHVTSEGDTYLVDGAACGRSLIRAFTRDPAGALDTRCADAIPAVHTPDFGATPATLVSGPDPGEPARRAATVAANALADAAVRSFYSEDRHGLRGGTFSINGERITLHGVRFAGPDPVGGSGTFHYATGAVSGTLTVGTLTIRVAWTQATPTATATVNGAVLHLPAP